MSSPRVNRIKSDGESLMALNRQSRLLRVKPVPGDDTWYKVVYECRGLARENGEIREVDFHLMDVYLHKNYPRQPPRLEWQTEIFHPNILSVSRGGGVCVGAWAPSESLQKLVVRIGEMVQYKIYNLSDALDLQARDWAATNLERFPVDGRELIGRQ